MKTLIVFLNLAIIFILLGCGRTDNPSSIKTTSKDNNIFFNIVSSTNTIKDQTGHFSIIYQAKDSSAKPISGLENANYTIYENNSKTSESRIYVSKDQKSASNNILLLLDFSGSIIQDCDQIDATYDPSTNQYIINNESSLEDNPCFKLITSAKQFVDKTVTNSQKMAIYYFNSKRTITALVTSTTASATSDKIALKSGLDQLYSISFRKQNLQGYISTNLYGAVVESIKTACEWVGVCDYDIYKPENINVDNFNFASIVIFTDGVDQAGIVTEQEMLKFASKHSSLYYYTIGLGNVNDRVLKQIGKDSYMKASDTQSLDKEFDLLADELNSWANSFYKIDYCPATQEGEVNIKIRVIDEKKNLFGTLSEVITLPNGIDFKCDI